MQNEKKHVKYTYEVIKRTEKYSEPWWAIIFLNQLAYPFVYVIANYTNATPNTLTILSFITGVLAAYIYLLGTYEAFVFGAFFFTVSYVLDAADGKLARVKKEETQLGSILDRFRDKIVHVACMLGLTIGAIKYHQSFTPILFGAIYLILLVINSLVSFVLQYKINMENNNRFTINMFSSCYALEKLTPITFLRHRAYPIPGAIEWTTVLFVFAPIMNNIFLGFLLSYGSIIYSILYIFKQILKR